MDQVNRRIEEGGDDAATAGDAPAQPKAERRSPWRRRLLLGAGPVVLVVVALVLYFRGGGTVSEADSYVGAPNVTITAQVAGQVVEVDVAENQRVAEGAVLFRLDPEPFQIAVNQAKAQLQETREKLQGLVLTYRQAEAEVQQNQADVTYAQQQFDRASSLVDSGVGTRSDADAARRDLRVAQDQLVAARASASSTLAQLGGSADTPTEQQATYLQAQAALQSAERDLRLATVTAPFAGIATQVDNIAVGSYLTAGRSAFTLVSTDAWVDSNLKETDLVHVKVGDEADVVVDNYPDLVLRGKVASVAPASGSVFSLLPAQNASGNWVKVVQRIPVRVTLDDVPDGVALRVGSSATVSIETGYHRTPQTLWDDVLGLVGL
ncbi:HlyD family secretion protein [Aureimonas flava]|uniref:HlyD family secretion protein n=1 Tax=Aureimonas flava TaxID=2320271 RepID=A0A3A1WNI0_9HYPH|nr:HlyD family secretion protein [Aureimonas flava]RIY03458.1 HlyD family secretion protein [Aureimonas flava]